MTSVLNPAEAFPPSEYLRDELEERGWTEVEFAQILDRPAQVVSEILNDRKEITPETALELGRALGTSAELWLNLQTVYQLSKARSRVDLTPVERRARLRNMVPVRELRNREWIEDIDDLDVLETEVRTFLRIEDLGETPFLPAAARRSNDRDTLTPPQTAWIARVRNLASHSKLKAYDKEKLASLASELPHMLRDPFELRDLKTWLAECGVVLVVELPLRSSKIDGAALRISDLRVIGLSARGNRFDSLVFTLLHEIAHLILEHVSDRYVLVDEELASTPASGALETEANDLAASWIFPDGIAIDEPITIGKILEVAAAHNVHPSLVIGRLQWVGKLEWNRYRSRIPRVRELLIKGNG